MKYPAIILALFFCAIGFNSCVSVAVSNANKMTEAGAKVEKVFIVADTEGKFFGFYGHVIKNLSDDLKERGLKTDSIMLKKTGNYDEKIFYDAKLKALSPCHILTVKEISSKETIDENHIDEDATIEVTLKLSGQDKVLWRSEIKVASGGVLGVGSMNTGTGGKLTAQKITWQLEQDKLIPFLGKKEKS